MNSTHRTPKSSHQSEGHHGCDASQTSQTLSDDTPPTSAAPGSRSAQRESETLPGRRTGPTGPRTASGKTKASKNATTHGATSKAPISAQEHGVYETFLGQLKAQYPTNSPLIGLQLERIARLKVQLDRIQTTITALHEIERLRVDDIERAAQIMELTDEDRSHFASIWRMTMSRNYNPADRPYAGLIPVAIELTGIDDLDLLTTHEEFLKRAPMFCEYLVKRATKEEVDVKDYARSKQVKEPVREVFWGNGRRGNKTKEAPPVQVRLVGPDDKDEINTDVREVDVVDLVKTAKWHRLELMRLISRSERVSNLQRVSEIASQAALPDLDKLDRLMRYQTTVNRQLSSAVGELLELLKH